MRKAIRVAILWNRALDLASKQKFCEALQFMEEIDGIVDDQQVEFILFRGYLYFATAENEKASKILYEVHKIITESKLYSKEEK